MFWLLKSASEASSRWPIISHSSMCDEHESSEMMWNTRGPSLWWHGTATLIAVSVTDGAQHNAITGRDETAFLQRNYMAEGEYKKTKIMAQRRHRTVPQPYWWLPPPKFCSPEWFDSCNVSSSAAWSAVCWHPSSESVGTENKERGLINNAEHDKYSLSLNMKIHMEVYYDTNKKTKQFLHCDGEERCAATQEGEPVFHIICCTQTQMYLI